VERFIFFTALILWVAGFTFVMIKRRSRTNEALMEDFIEAERNANSARRKDIDPALFFTPDLSILPAGDKSSKAYAQVVKHAGQRMLRFEAPVSNMELKLAYGPSQLEDIAIMEESFNKFIRALIEWAEDLIAAGINGDALRILEYTLELGSDYIKSYTLAADIYARDARIDKLNELTALAERRAFNDESIRRRIIKHIMMAKEGIQ
jgi:hypothetical protein